MLTVPGVPNEPLGRAGWPGGDRMSGDGVPKKFYIDAEIQTSDQPLIRRATQVSVLYKVSSGGIEPHPIKATGARGLFDSPLGADRMRIANGVRYRCSNRFFRRCDDERSFQTDSRCRMASSVSVRRTPCAMI